MLERNQPKFIHRKNAEKQHHFLVENKTIPCV